ncbi:TetR/AcrR family transcriptional regulator [Dactylosporangium aurantiacum]|uniref:TetR/AcrR family transcriptional regulator n=1 Tax=Dactylosporangium aurantiacum TaxID=35754 RepID=A0A9Q9INQ3_9ACTN|nr:TetR/AcrR family transcriptional regulator [Dactylosporangium aurantiacum]MDG6109337.1 TetR/AcrR family transcriptional regulator [Dactylosporangium aurantiacum]UWZ56445.1 TetR/AcrR family transcriptional regulator [Dactylosporangium aurantiacum]
MGNKEKLLDGALQCLLDKGYARTTARDVASTAGVSLAAIGYHFGTTDALLNAALDRALEAWGAALEAALRDEGDAALDPAARFTAIWTRIIASVEAQPALWKLQFEVVAQLAVLPELHERWQHSLAQAQEGLAALFGGSPGTGALYQALLTGVVVQHLVAPGRGVGGAELAAALLEVAGRLRTGEDAAQHV